MYEIGQRIKIKDWDELPEKYKHKGMAKVAGKSGTVVDAMHSALANGNVYLVKCDDHKSVSSIHFEEYVLEEEHEDIPMGEITFKITVLDDVVVGHILEDGKMVATGHAHIFHDGIVGIAHAASYALKKIFIRLDEQNGGNIYVKNDSRKD